MEWLSRGVEVLIDDIQAAHGKMPGFDVVVVGSGYGGSVAAARLANAPMKSGGFVSLCLLERGNEYVPGEFPNHMRDLPGHVRVDLHDKDELYGRPDALFDYRSNPDVSVLVGNALGGGSQINAAVALRADSSVFGAEPWPSEFHDDKHLLDPFCARAEQMLGVSVYPDDDRRPKLAKLAELKSLGASYSRWPYAAPSYTFSEVRHYLNGQPIRGHGVSHVPERREPTFKRLPLAITFSGKDVFEEPCDPKQVAQKKCLQCGDCVSGCNFWAKNTLTMNYLPSAHRNGAQLFTGAKVIRVLHADKARKGRSWRVEFIRTAYEKEFAGAEGKPQPGTAAATSYEVYADVVILAAGTLGSTEILMRSRRRSQPGPRRGATKASNSAQTGPDYVELSNALGTRFSANGDMMAVGFGQTNAVHPIGCGAEHPKTRKFQTGPMAAGVLDFTRVDNFSPPIIIQDGAIPGALKRLFGEIVTTASMISQFTENAPRDDGKTDPMAVSPSSIDHSAVYLMMGMDRASGWLSLDPLPGEGLASDIKRKGITLHWDKAAEDPVYCKQQQLMQQVHALGGTPLMSPTWELLPAKLAKVLEGNPPEGKLVTTHPLGGCPMGDDAARGVVNHLGQVFAGVEGDALHKGLYVCDGSIIPTALAVNPLLTITALAERSIEALAKKRGWTPHTVSAETSLPPLRVCPQPYREARAELVAVNLRERMNGVLCDVEPGAVAAAFGTPDEQAKRPGEAPRPSAIRSAPRPDSAEHKHELAIDFEVAVPDLDAFLEDVKHEAQGLSVSRLYVDKDWKYGARLAPQAGKPHSFKGSFSFLVRERSNQEQRMFRALTHWWRLRGYASTMLEGRPELCSVLTNLLNDKKEHTEVAKAASASGSGSSCGSGES